VKCGKCIGKLFEKKTIIFFIHHFKYKNSSENEEKLCLLENNGKYENKNKNKESPQTIKIKEEIRDEQY
jgi:hypothetical protein